MCDCGGIDDIKYCRNGVTYVCIVNTYILTYLYDTFFRIYIYIYILGRRGPAFNIGRFF